MNPLPPNADELVSAYLDGEAAPDEIAIVESNPELMARVQAMRAVSGMVGTPVSPPAAQKEAHIAAALGAFDELFGASETPAEPIVAAPTLAAVPTPVEAPTPPAASDTTVTSFDAARQRRRPRRMNMGVIAAAIAAVLLIGAFAVFSGGRASDDLATSAPEAAFDTASDAVESSADAGSDEAMEDSADAMAAEAPVEEAETEGRTALSDAAGSAPAATPPPPAAAQAEPLEQDDAAGDVDQEAMDEEEAMEEEAAADAAAEPVEAGADFDAADLALSPFYLGEFETDDQLTTALTELSSDELSQRKATIGQGLFARCQSRIPELAPISSLTLIADAIVGGEPREVHVLGTEENNRTFFVVDPRDCTVLSTFP